MKLGRDLIFTGMFFLLLELWSSVTIGEPIYFIAGYLTLGVALLGYYWMQTTLDLKDKNPEVIQWK